MPSTSRRPLALSLAGLTLLTAAPLSAHAAPAAPAGAESPVIDHRPVRTTATDDVLFRESFDDLERRPEMRGDDSTGATDRTPHRWSSTTTAPESETGWQGWTFTDRSVWAADDDSMRTRFGREQGLIAVVDSAEVEGLGEGESFASSLSSAPVRVDGQDSIQLSFDSHYRGAPGQSGTVSVSFDGGPAQEVVRLDSSTVADGYDPATMNSQELHDIEVPDGARTAEFTWDFEAQGDDWYWAIDSVRVSESLDAPEGEATSAWVFSDVQGHPADLSHSLKDLHEVRPDAGGMLFVGDQTDSGSVQDWAEIYDVMEENAAILPPVMAAAIGNHESYNGEGWPTHRDRFLEFADREKTYGEYMIEGEGADIPVLVLGQEEDRYGLTEVPMSAEQLEWFDERLDYWTKQDKQVLVASHFPLGDTVSASWIPWYSEHYQYNDLVTEILADHPNAVMLSGHTHYPAELGDWAVQRRADSGHPDGFWAVNTLAMHVGWDARGEDTSEISEVTVGDVNQGLTVDAYDDRMVITAREFGPVATTGEDNEINEEIRSITIPNPLVR